MKKTFAIVLAVLMLFSGSAVLASAETALVYGSCGDNGSFILDVDNRILEISGTCDAGFTVNQGQGMSSISGAYTKVIIDDNTVIKTSLFSGNKNIKEVTIGSGVKFNIAGSNGVSVFNGCTSLNTVTLQGDHYSIPAYCFKDCTSLGSFDFTKVDSLGIACFQNCGLKGTVDLSKLKSTTGLDGVSAARIYESAFQGCKGITYVILPLNAGRCIIEDSAFEGCTSLSKLTNGSNCIPRNVSKIGDRAFFDCNLLFVLFEGEKVEIGEKAFGYISGDGKEAKYAGFTVIAEEGTDGYNYGTSNSLVATPHDLTPDPEGEASGSDEKTPETVNPVIDFFNKIIAAIKNFFNIIVSFFTSLISAF